MTALREAILREARSWLGTPFRHAARVKGHGVDCGMFLLEVYHRVGVIPFIDPGPYPPQWFLRSEDCRYLNLLRELAAPVPEALPGDVALYQVGRAAGHAGIVAAWPTVIHAHGEAGVVEECGATGLYRGSFLGHWRFHGVPA